MLDSEINSFIDGELRKEKVVIFSKSTCKFSTRAKRLLQVYNYPFHTIELDEMGENGALVQDKLMFKTGQSTVPNIFLSGHHLGGCEELELLDAAGLLEEIIDGKIDLTTKFDYDMIIIGGGSAGLSAATGCAKHGMSVCLINYVKPTPRGTTWGLGGTCTNVGCVPKKLIHRAAILGSDLRDAPLYGWNLPADLNVEHDWTQMVTTIQEYIESLNWRIKKDLLSNRITYLNGIASLVSNHEVNVKVNESEINLSCKNIVIAVGGRPRYLEFPGSEECITSDDIFSQKEFPGKTLIVGGSYVALEIASFLNSLKAEVAVMVRSDLLNSIMFDRDMVNTLETEMTREGVKFLHNCTLLKVTRDGDLLQVECLINEETPYTDEFNTVVLAVGRIPSTDGLNLEGVGIKTCTNCKIPVNEREQTVVKNIVALGDCANGRPELSSAAIASGRLFSKRIKTRDCHCIMDYRNVPTSLFTWPEFACCGASESVANQMYGQTHVKAYTASITPLERVVTEPAAKCSAKLVTYRDHNDVERVAGLHMVGPNASEIIQGFALALKMGASKKDLDCFFGIHPTCAEIFTSLSLKGNAQPLPC